MLTWLHIGDLHLSHDDDYESVKRLQSIVTEANHYLTDAVDFALLPGDNANNGTSLQYGKINEALNDLTLPVYAIPGDHDFEPSSLDAFYGMVGSMPLPRVIEIEGRHCLFLDVVSAGSGGPDFRLGAKQMRWLEETLSNLSLRGAPAPIVFMHGYPGDHRGEGEYLGQLFARNRVALVDTGHTHYNELLNDGRVIYAATRSTGQVEEGEGQPGYSVVAVDGAVVSWRFKPLSSPWPFVLITSPSDCRLVIDRMPHQQVPEGTFELRAKIIGEDVVHATADIDHGAPVAMHRVEDEPSMWAVRLTTPASGHAYNLRVMARCSNGSTGTDTITVFQRAAFSARNANAALGTDAHAVAPWPDHHVLGTQLGPNKFGKKW